jgi:transposase
LTARDCSVLLSVVTFEQRRIAELEAENAQLRATVVELRATVERLVAEVAALKAQMGKDSTNSSLPPSRDDLAARQSRQVRRAAQRKAGGKPGKQPGAPGSSLSQRADPDVVVRHRAGACGGCGAGLDDAEVVGEVRRQVFDIPEPKIVVTEHVAQRCRCRCGAETNAAFPPEARAPACWGPRLGALALYLLVRQHVPVARCAELLKALGAPVSTGWVAGQVGRAAAALATWLVALRRALMAEAVVHADETSGRVAGTLWWFHVVCTKTLTLLVAHRRRGRQAIDDIGVLGQAQGILVHDRLASYWAYGRRHAVCGAHLLRDLAGIAEVPGQRRWAEAMTKALLEAKAAADQARARGRPKLSWQARRRIDDAYTVALRAALDATASDTMPPRGPRRDAMNLAVAFFDYRDEILAFTTDLTVDFSNNQAERDLRMAKLQQKISGGWRTEDGIKAFADVRSYIDTGRKHGQNPLSILTQLLTTGPWQVPSPAGAT